MPTPLLATALALALAQIPTAVLPPPPSADTVLARVNGVPIRAEDVEALLWDWRGREVTADLITYQLVQGEAKKLKVEAKPEEIEREFQRRLDLQKQQVGDNNLEETLRAQGFPKSRLFLRVHTEMLVDRIAMLDFDPSQFVKVSTIVFQPNMPGESPLKRAEAALAALGKGGTWDKAVADSDLTANGKAAMGKLGWKLLSAFPESARDDIRKLKTKAYSQPVTMADGSVQVFLLEDRGSAASGDDAADIQAAFLERMRPQLLQRLRAEAKIERSSP